MITREAKDIPNEAFQLAKKYINGDPEGDFRKFLEIRTVIYEAMQEAISDLIRNKGIYIDKKKLTNFDGFLKDLISNSPDDPSQLNSYIDEKLFNYLVSTIGTTKRKAPEDVTKKVEEVKKEPVVEEVKNVREKGIDSQEVETRKLIEDIRKGINYDDNISKLFKMYVDMLKSIVYKHPGLAEFKFKKPKGDKIERVPGSVYIDPRIEDVIAETIEPFIKAINDFDLEGSTKFSTFLYTYVDQYLKNMYTTKRKSKLQQEGEFEFILTHSAGKVDKLDEHDAARLKGFDIKGSKIVDDLGNEYKEGTDYTFDGEEITWIGKMPKEGEEYKIILDVSKSYENISLSTPLSDGENEESESVELGETISEPSVDILKALESDTDKIRELYAESVGYDLNEEDKEMDDLLSKIWADINLEREEKKRDLSDEEVKDIILKMFESSIGMKLSDLDLNDPEEKVLHDKLVSSIDEIFNYIIKENSSTTEAKKKMIFFDLIHDYDMGTARRIMTDRFKVVPSTLTEWLSRHVNPSIAKALGIEYYTHDNKLSSEHLYNLIKAKAK